MTQVEENTTPGQQEPVIIHTDGGCAPNPGVGGWAAVLSYQGRTRELSGGERATTNNRMELTAAVEALKALKRSCRVCVFTDSEYVRRGITEWLPGWKKRNWVRKTGALKNEDLWKELDRQARRHTVEWRWVRGHAGDPMNERCDELAGLAIERLRRE
jgi:ribonuclease HI